MILAYNKNKQNQPRIYGVGSININMKLDEPIYKAYWEVLNMTRNIYETYQNAPDFMKQLYLRFFFERIEIKNKKVSKYIATPTFQTLLEGHKVLKLTTQLPLKDLFVNRKVEFDTDLDSLKILFTELNLPHPQNHITA